MPGQGSPSERATSTPVIIEVPRKLSKEQREKLVEFSKSCGDTDLSAEEGFMGKAKRFSRNDLITINKKGVTELLPWPMPFP